MLCRPASIFVDFDIAFMYSKTTGYQIDNVITITMKDPPRIISTVGDTACEIIELALLALLLGYKDGANNSLNDSFLFNTELI